MAEVHPQPLHMPLATRIQAYAGALAFVALSTLVGLWVAPRWGTAAVDMLYLPAVLASAALWGIGPGLIAGMGAALGYNFFFTEPVHTLRIDRVTDVVTVAVLLIVALVTSRLAGGIRSQARLAAAHAERNATIAGFARRLLSSSTPQEVAKSGCDELRQLFDCNAVIVSGLPKPSVIASAPAENRLTPSDVAAAALTLQSGQPSGRATARIQPAEWQFHAISVSGSAIAAIGLARDDGAPPVNEAHLALLTNLLDQLALALERSRAEADRQEVSALRDRDRLRSALLSSVGHDLRTPLTAIIAAAGELRRSRSKGSALVATIEAEASKLERYISNLLDMARIEAGAVKLRVEAVDLVDAVAAALKDLRTDDGELAAVIDLPDDLPLVNADPQLLHHCLINLLDNAAHHSRKRPVRIAAANSGDEVQLSVEDEGPGLPQDEERALDAFMRIEGSDRKGGTGLGLAIVKAFSEAMGARVTAANRQSGGAIFTIRFPKRLLIATVGTADVG
jgi:two-component system, OmpR family, sensor histidine kinase KdpD